MPGPAGGRRRPRAGRRYQGRPDRLPPAAAPGARREGQGGPHRQGGCRGRPHAGHAGASRPRDACPRLGGSGRARAGAARQAPDHAAVALRPAGVGPQADPADVRLQPQPGGVRAGSQARARLLRHAAAGRRPPGRAGRARPQRPDAHCPPGFPGAGVGGRGNGTGAARGSLLGGLRRGPARRGRARRARGAAAFGASVGLTRRARGAVAPGEYAGWPRHAGWPGGTGQPMSISLSRRAIITASIREWICSFSRMLRTWFITAFTEMNSSLAMSRLFMPLATSLSTSISRSVSFGAGTCWTGSSSVRRPRVANSVRSLPAMKGLIRDCPPWTERTASATEGGEFGEELAGHEGADQGLPAVDRTDGLGDLVQRDVLEQVAARARPDGLEQVFLLVTDRQHDDLRARHRLLHGPARLDAAAPGHPDVHEHDVGQRLADLHARFAAVARLADEIDVVLLVENHLEPAAEQRVVIDDEHADGLRTPPGIRSLAGRLETCAQPELLPLRDRTAPDHATLRYALASSRSAGPGRVPGASPGPGLDGARPRVNAASKRPGAAAAREPAVPPGG